MTPWILSCSMSLFTVFLRFLNCSRLPDFLALSREAVVARVSRLRLIFGLSGLNLIAFIGATVSSASFTSLLSSAKAYVAMSTKSNGVKINGFLFQNLDIRIHRS